MESEDKPTLHHMNVGDSRAFAVLSDLNSIHNPSESSGCWKSCKFRTT